MFIDIPTSISNRSISPMSPSPYRERGLGFFDILTRRFARRSHDDICYQHHGEEDSRSSSTDSCSSTSDGRLTIDSKDSNSNRRNHNSNLEISCSSDSGSSNSSGDASNTSSSREHNNHRRSTSSIRRALQNFSLSSRSLSCSSTLPAMLYKNSGSDGSGSAATTAVSTKQKKTKKTPAPKRILRQPVSYTYLKGMSGLPTQRVPRSSVCCQHTHR